MIIDGKERHPDEEITQAVAELHELDGDGLCRRWRTLVGKPLPLDLGRSLTLRVLAYKLQAQRLGDLNRATLRALTAFRQKESKAPDSGTGPNKLSPADPEQVEASHRQPDRPWLPTRPGTLLVREHVGVLHRVMVLEEGVSWNGKVYDSLSQVAFAITGTKWNGPRFFGLREPSSADARKTREPSRRSTS